MGIAGCSRCGERVDGHLFKRIQKDICLGVPVTIGKNGWEKILDLDLNADEKAAFAKSADAVRNMNDVLKTL